MKPLWHYTCSDHKPGIDQAGKLLPLGQLTGVRSELLTEWAWPLLELVWMTDLERPIPEALGLTAHILGCDRTEHRYRVVDYPRPKHWLTCSIDDFPRSLRNALNSAPGAMPAHWWFATEPVPVVYDPTPVVRSAS